MAEPYKQGDKQVGSDSDLSDVMAEERSRGRRRQPDVRTVRERQRFRRDISRLFEAEEERGFIAALQRAKIPEPHFSEALRVWRDLKGTR